MNEIFLRRVDANHTVLQKMNIKKYFLPNYCEALERGATVTRYARMSFNLGIYDFSGIFPLQEGTDRYSLISFSHWSLRPANGSTSRASSPTLRVRGVDQR